jgi:hypothetical protein
LRLPEFGYFLIVSSQAAPALRSDRQPQFQVSYWPEGVGSWAPFGRPVSAWTPREALERCRPQAFGRYRVVRLGQGEPEKLFRAVGTPRGCAIREVDSAAHADAPAGARVASSQTNRRGGAPKPLAPGAVFPGGVTISLVPTFNRSSGGG